MPFPFYKQPDQMDCGPTCLRMVSKHYGQNFKLQTLPRLCKINKEGGLKPLHQLFYAYLDETNIEISDGYDAIFGICPKAIKHKRRCPKPAQVLRLRLSEG
jgi:hypothetical protein